MSKWGMGVRRWMAAALMVVGAALSASPANAEWREARARHFILYGNMSESDIRAMATRLEQFDAVLRYFFALPEIEGQESNPVTVYVVPNGAAVRRLYGKGSDNVLGFYQPRVSGSVAFTPMRGEGDNPNDMQPQQVLFHEYAHHFLVGNSSSAYPAWFSEGFAEFTGTAKFDRTGVMVGVAAQHRAYGLLMASKLPIETLFDSVAPQAGQHAAGTGLWPGLAADPPDHVRPGTKGQAGPVFQAAQHRHAQYPGG
ncbi:hypothetical protein P0F65_20880 [Sphingomonas sp. I4]